MVFINPSLLNQLSVNTYLGVVGTLSDNKDIENIPFNINTITYLVFQFLLLHIINIKSNNWSTCNGQNDFK